MNAQPGSVLLWPAAAAWMWEKSEALGILDRGTRSGPAAEALQGAHGADVVKRRRRQGDDDPGRLDRRSDGMEDMRWAGTHDGGRLQRDVGQFRCDDRQVQNLDQDCAGRGLHVRGICSLHTRRDVQRGQILWVLNFSTLLLSGHFGGTEQQWGRQHGGRGFGAADLQVEEKTGPDCPAIQGYSGTAHCSTRRWWPRVCRG